MANSSITSNANQVAKQVEYLRKQMTKEVDRDTEEAIYDLLEDLKESLAFIVNNQLRVGEGERPQSLAQSVAEAQAIGKKELTSMRQEWYTGAESPLYRGFSIYDKQGNRNIAMRVRRTDIPDNADYEDYISSFEQTLTEKVFAIENGNGDYNYYVIPPNSLLLDQVLEDTKIFCSEYTDSATYVDDDGDPIDIGKQKGREKFERDKKKGHTEFTIKSRSLKLIEQLGTNVTDVVLATQHGEYEDAYNLAQSKSGPAAKKIQERTAKALEDDISPEAQALGASNQAIKSASVKKSVTEHRINYKITVDTNDQSGQMEANQELGQVLARESLVWASGAEGPLKNAVHIALEEAFKNFNRG